MSGFHTDPRFYGMNSEYFDTQPQSEATQIVQKFKDNSVIYFNNEPFFLVRHVRKNAFKNMQGVKTFQELHHADVVKQNNDYYFFVRTIPYVEFEEILNEEEIIE